jgi:MFS transporter, DHA3 family, macrolide efflux protein
MEESMKLKRATYHLYTFTVSKLISSFGAQVYAFAISFYILQITGSATSFATNLLCNILPRTIISPFAGAIADKYPRKVIVILAQIATTLTIGGLLIFTITSGLSLVAIYVTTCILAISSSFSIVAFSSSITGLIDKDRIQKAMSLNQMSISFASIGSPAIGGLLYGTVSIKVILLMYIAASCLAIILESTMNFTLFSATKQENGEENKETMWQSMKAGMRYLKMKTIILTMMGMSILINFLFGAFEVGYSYILIDQLKMSSQHFGFTQGAFSIGMLLLSIYFSMRKEVLFPFLVAKRGILGMGTFIAGISLPLIIGMPYYVMFSYYLVLMFGFGSVLVVINTPIQVMLQKMIDDEYKGRVFSIIETNAMALIPIGMVIYGFLYDVFPAQWILLISAGLLIGIVLVLARPAVVRKVHPEINEESALKTNSGDVNFS